MAAFILVIWFTRKDSFLPTTSSSTSSHTSISTTVQLETAADHNLAALPTPTGCTPREALVQGGFFRALWQGEGFTTHTRCPSFSYLLDIAVAMQQQHRQKDANIVMFDVGCNKGYDTAAVFELWRPSTGLTRRSLGEFIISARASSDPDTAKGVCSDADSSFGEAYKTYTPPPANKQGGLQVHCFEPSSLNHELLQQVHTHFFDKLPADEAERLQVHRMAFSNITGTTFFSKDCATESCHIQASGSRADVVNVTTVDAMVAQLQLDSLFLLKIDTEGFDPLVLHGAQGTLAAHKVTILQFEYHQLGVWRQHSLQDITQWLDSLGYVCYFDGTLLTMLTGCWDPLLEFRQWSNVVCTLKNHLAHKVLASYSLAPFEGRFRKLALLGGGQTGVDDDVKIT